MPFFCFGCSGTRGSGISGRVVLTLLLGLLKVTGIHLSIPSLSLYTPNFLTHYTSTSGFIYVAN